MRRLIKNLLTQSNAFSKRLQSWSVFIYGTTLVLVALIFLFQLQGGGRLPGYSLEELGLNETLSTLPHILENFLYYPYYFIAYIVNLFVDNPPLAGRLTSVLFGLSSCLLLVFLLKRRFGVFITTAGVLLFAANSWFLHLARTATPEGSLITAALLLLMTWLLFLDKPQNKYCKVFFVLAVVIAWFMPLLPTLMVIFIFFVLTQIQLVKRYCSRPWQMVFVFVLAGLGSLTTLAYQAAPSSIHFLLGLPEQFQPGLFLQNLLSTLQALVWQAPYNPNYWLARLPFLDIFLGAMLLLGVYALYKNSQKAWRWSGLCFAVVLLLAATLNHGIKTSGFLLFLLAAFFTALTGLNYLFDYWKRVFPINPIARTINIVLVTVLISTSFYYQVTKYFVAWSNHPETREIYSNKNVNSD